MICPSCKDHPGKTGPCFVNRLGGRHTIEVLRCFTCRGSAEITDEHFERIQAGKRIRAARITANRTQRETAASFGLKVGEYSGLEHGREPETEKGREAWRELIKGLEVMQ